jgi:L-asparaginase II
MKIHALRTGVMQGEAQPPVICLDDSGRHVMLAGDPQTASRFAGALTSAERPLAMT